MGLQEGFTTGSAATAAALAALMLLRTARAPDCVTIPLPPFVDPMTPRAWMSVAIAGCRLLTDRHRESEDASEDASEDPSKDPSKNELVDEEGRRWAEASVVKEAGDDPDVTNHVRVFARVCQDTSEPPRTDISFAEAERAIVIEGGEGIGRASVPGLPVPPGAWAINPVPQQQIRAALWLFARSSFYPLRCVLSVPGGAELAGKTFNPRLGILGGISILGTQGTVKPFSHEAYRATIVEQISVAKALSLSELFFSTGRRSEAALQGRYPSASPYAFIQVADHFDVALPEARNAGMALVTVGLFFGKLVKIAQGHLATHAHAAQIDFSALADVCSRAGFSSRDVIEQATTANAVLASLTRSEIREPVLSVLAQAAVTTIQQAVQCRVRLCLFGTDGTLLHCLEADDPCIH